MYIYVVLGKNDKIMIQLILTSIAKVPKKKVPDIIQFRLFFFNYIIQSYSE